MGLLVGTEWIAAGDLAGPMLPQREPTAPMAAEVPEVLQTASLEAPGEPAIDAQLVKPAVPMPKKLAVQGEAPDDAATFKPLLTLADLTGWKIHEGRADAWKNEENIVRCSGAGAGWLLTEQKFSDFVLRFDYRLPPGGNSGVAIRCASEGNPAFSGMEIQLLDDDAPKYEGLSGAQYTGAIYYRAAPHTKAPLNPAGEWNACEIRCVGPQVEILINGTVVNKVTLRTGQATSSIQEPSAEGETDHQVSLDDRPPVGQIGLQSYPGGAEFRRLMIHDLSRKLPSGLQLSTLQEGAGESAGPNDTVALHYVGQLADGTSFTNTYSAGEPIVVSLKDVITGWKEGISGMKVGERRKLIVPPELGYGEEGVDNLIPSQATLIFEVELCRVER